MELFEIIWLFIIIYFLYRLFFAPRQSQKRQAPPEWQKEDSESTQTRDEILEEMRTIFEDEPITTKPPPPKSQRSGYQTTPTREKIKRQSEGKFAKFTGTDFIDTTSRSSILEEEIVLTSPQTDEEQEQFNQTLSFLYDFDELKRGVIMSEVLAKPKARRIK